MYSQAVIDRNLTRVVDGMKAADSRFQLFDYPDEVRKRYVGEIAALYDPESKTLRRPLNANESDFIRNERILSRVSYPHFANNYVQCYLDDLNTKVGPMRLWESQQFALSRIAQAEDEMHDEIARGATRVDGICFFMHKGRQVGFTMLIESMAAHRTNCYANIRGLAGSVDDEKTQLIYHDRYKMAITNLPWWLQTEIVSDVKDRGMKFSNGSRMQLQDASQISGFAQGNQWDFSHLTECSSWPDPSTQIENHFYPSIPRSIHAAAFLESTAQLVAKGGPLWWQRNTELARKRRLGRWRYVFIPWYMVSSKYSAMPPSNWQPLPSTLEHARMVEETSAELVGRTVHLSADQLYWWEQEHEAASNSGSLSFFYANYPATPEESFQYGRASSFTVETIAAFRSAERRPVPYVLVDATTPPLIDAGPDGPQTYRVGPHTLGPVASSELEDPRGLVLIWEPPVDSATYALGADTAGGVPGWSRLVIGTEADNPDDRDNATLSLWRSGKRDLQVAEFAAPVDEEQLAAVAFVLGRIYKGASDYNEALIHAEVEPRGAAFHQALVRMGYSNFMPRYRIRDGVITADPLQFGWASNNKSMQLLWAHSKRHGQQQRAATRSKWLVQELTTLVHDPLLRRMAAESGYHDDRAIAAFLAWWALNNWAFSSLADSTPLVTAAAVNARPVEWQSSDITYGEMLEEWDDVLGNLLDNVN